MNMAFKGCPRPCKITSYRFSPLISTESARLNSSYFLVYLVSNDIQSIENVRLFDTNSILGTIGGSLGLFLGFSFLSCVQKSSRWLIKNVTTFYFFPFQMSVDFASCVQITYVDPDKKRPNDLESHQQYHIIANEGNDQNHDRNVNG